MRKLAVFAVAAAFFGAASAASAADLSMKDMPYEPAPAAIWGGLYVGGHLGGLWTSGDSLNWQSRCKGEERCFCKWCTDTDWKTVDSKHFKFESDRDDDTSLIGGIQVGYNWQFGNRVFGIEGDASFGDNINYLASLRARLGYAMDSLLIYATAGVAFAGFDGSKITLDTPWGPYLFDKTDDERKVGAVVGGGVEYKLAANWSVGVEGLYYAFADSKDVYNWDLFCKEYKLTDDHDNNLFVARARINYFFGGEEYEAPLK